MHINNIDLHYHAGQERPKKMKLKDNVHLEYADDSPLVSLRDYLIHAQVTGRKVLGVTDHFGLYRPKEEDRDRPYERSLQGLKQFHRELFMLEDEFPDLTLFFAPEVGSSDDLDAIEDGVIELADFFIFEPPFVGTTPGECTRAVIERMEEIRDFVSTRGVMAYIAHPFRSAVNFRLVKRQIKPWITELAPRDDCSFSNDEVRDFFLMDMVEIGRAAAEWGLAIEINGNTHSRILSSNLPAPLQMLWSAYRILHREGVDFVPGSDQHGFLRGVGRMGGTVPYFSFEILDLGVDDLRFVQELLHQRG